MDRKRSRPVSVAGTIYYFAFGERTAFAKPTIEVKTMPVEICPAKQVDKILRKRQFTGVIKAERASNLSFERTGSLIELKVIEGTVFKQNQVLAVLDTRNLDAQKKQLAAQHHGIGRRCDQRFDCCSGSDPRR